MQEYKPVILIVDDAPENLKALEKLLGEIDATLVFATDGDEAVEKAVDIRPDLVLLDILMPNMDGDEACKRIKENPETASVSVIFLTALSKTEDILKGFEAGAVDYVSKPFKSAELLARVKSQLSIKKFTRDLEIANATKNKFFSIIAHDLKNPFATITGFAEMLIQGIDKLSPEEMMSYLELIHSSGKEASGLLENLLNWSRLKVGTFNANFYYLNSRELIDRVLRFLDPMAKRKNISLSASENPTVEVYADENMLETVLRNLGTNAIKYTNEGGKVLFKAGLMNNNKTFFVEVEDNGTGMIDEVKDNLFRIDVKNSLRGTNDEVGSGLGLVLSYEFMEFMGGSVEVESQEGAGSIFTIKLPLKGKQA